MNTLGSAATITNIMLDGPTVADPSRGVVALEGSAPMIVRPPCRRCGKPTPGRRTPPAIYCSKRCYDAARAEMPHHPRKYGRHLAQRHYAVRPCESCGAVTRPEMKGPARVVQRHHRDGDQMNNDASNIAFLCKPCHDEAHRLMREQGIGRMPGGPRPRIVALMRERALDRWHAAVQMRRDGYANLEIAEALKVDPASVGRWFKKYGEGR